NDLESVRVRKDGTRVPVSISGAPLRDAAGVVRGSIALVADVSERKRAQEERAQALAREQALALLEQRVEERTRELSTPLEASRQLASTRELQPLLGVMLDCLKEVVEYESASVAELQGDEVAIIAYRGPAVAEEALRVRLPVAELGA